MGQLAMCKSPACLWDAAYFWLLVDQLSRLLGKSHGHGVAREGRCSMQSSISRCEHLFWVQRPSVLFVCGCFEKCACCMQKDNVASCKEALDTNKRDLALIKDCITTTEVSLARVYNYDVAQKRKTKPKQGDS